MQSFHDTSGREWPIEVTVAAVKRVKRRLPVDLLAIGDVEAWTLANQQTVREVLCVLCEPDESSRGAFTFDEACAALCAAVQDLRRVLYPMACPPAPPAPADVAPAEAPVKRRARKRQTTEGDDGGEVQG